MLANNNLRKNVLTFTESINIINMSRRSAYDSDLIATARSSRDKIKLSRSLAAKLREHEQSRKRRLDRIDELFPTTSQDGPSKLPRQRMSSRKKKCWKIHFVMEKWMRTLMFFRCSYSSAVLFVSQSISCYLDKFFPCCERAREKCVGRFCLRIFTN